MKTRLRSLAVFCAVCLATSAPLFGDHPNIVLILVDDMGYGDANCYNNQSKIETPHIDRLAQLGMRFTDAHASGPLCHVSRYGLLTGQYPFRANPGAWGKRPTIAESRMTIGSLLQDVGYRTAMVGKWHLGFDQSAGYEKPWPGGPVDRGFDSFFGIRASTDIPPYFYIRDRNAVQPPTLEIPARSTEGWSPIQGEFWRAGKIAKGLELKDVLPTFTQEAIAVIDQHTKSETSKPLFLYLAYPAPHTPWLPSKPFQGSSKAGMYGDFAQMVDQQIGSVIGKLEETDLLKNTLVIFTSDNGPVWYEQDVDKFGHDSSGGLKGMKGDAWEAGHRMPFIVRWDQTVEQGAVCDQLISFVDVLATFADVVETSLPADQGPDSFSFLPLLKGSQQPTRKELALKAGRAMTYRIGDMKYIDTLGSAGFSKPRRVPIGDDGVSGQLYDLNDDPGESKNLFAEQQELVKVFENKIEAVLNKPHRSLVEE